MTEGKDVLFALWEGGGNAPPQLSVAGALVDRGHRVRVLADAILREEVEAIGAEHVAWTRAPQRTTWDPSGVIIKDYEARTPAGAFARVRDGIVTGPSAAYAADTLEEVERRRPDVLVRDYLLPGPGIAAEAAGVPTVVLVHSSPGVPEWGIPPIGPGFKPATGPGGRLRDKVVGGMNRRLFDKGLPALNAARREHGLAPASSAIEEVLKGDRLLLLMSRAFEFEQCRPPDNAVFVGPRLADPAWVSDWTAPAGDEPLVLVGLSSTFMDQVDVLRRIAAALGDLPVRGLITTGPAVDPDAIDAPANVTVVKSAPHREVLRHASAVVTHGGLGTMIKSLAAGVPVVAMPMGRDQLDNGARLEVAGAGIRIKPGAKPARIAGAVRSVLAEPGYAAGARRIADAIADELRSDLAVEEIETLARRNGAVAEVSAPAPVM
jgi:MGT family glycosyltransferase